MLKSSVQESSKNYTCNFCDYNTCRYSQYIRHINTAKHKNNEKSTEFQQNSTNINAKSSPYTCLCGKMYKERTGLWKHKKKCCANNHNQKLETETDTEIDTDNDEEIEIKPKIEIEPGTIPDKELIMMLVKQNTELLELVKNGTHHITHTNSHNKTFNLQFFLNETCKNAMNIMDFVDQIVLNLNDLEETGRIGFAEGVSKMILKRLKSLDITERPIHCSDAKRETLYIKDVTRWEKEDESKPLLTKAVKDIAYKNIKQIKTWQEKYPDYRDPSSKTNDKYMKMLTNVMAGGTVEEMEENYEKIIKNIIKETTIDKQLYAI